MDQTLSGPFDSISRYVHLGTNAYPSPFPGCGIEGVYMTFGREHEAEESPYDDGAEAEATFIVSTELVPGLAVTDPSEGDMPMHELVLASRQVTCRTRLRPDSTLGDLVGFGDNYVHGDASTWAPYLAAPLAAAHAALLAERAGIGVETGLYHLEGVDKKELRKWSRARTPEARDDFLEQFSREGGLVVRFVGGVPEAAINDSCVVAAVDHPFPRLDEPMAWARAYANMALGAEVPEVKEHFAARALACVGPILPMVERRPGMDRGAAGMAFLARSDAAASRKDRDGAVAALDRALRLVPPWLKARAKARVVALHVSAGDRDAALRAARALSVSNGEAGLSPWTDALLEARFGDAAAAVRKVRGAETLAPGSICLLLDRHDNDAFRWMQPRDRSDDDVLACALQHAAWRTVPGFADLLRGALPA